MNKEFLTLTIEGPLTEEDRALFNSNNWDYLTKKPLSGGSEIVQVLIGLSPLVITTVGDVIKTYIKNKRFIKFKCDDVEIENATEKEITNILKSVFDGKKKLAKAGAKKESKKSK